jgi:F0F1-type ATP synthase assembly protein I
MPPEDRPEVKASQVAAQARKATNQAAMALELPFVMVGTIALGAAIGYFLDRSFHTKPILMFIFGALGFAGGVREIIRRLPG